MSLEKMFLLLILEYLPYVSMKDVVSFERIEPWCHLGMPTILGNPKKVDEFFGRFFGNVFDSTKINENGNKKSDYIDEINKIFNNHFNISDEYKDYESQEEHNCFLSLPMNTNVSFNLDFKYGDREETPRQVMTL